MKRNIFRLETVLLKNDSSNRNYWKLAKIEELIFGQDGKVRAAVVRVANGNTNRLVHLRRVIQHLIPIEVKSCSTKIAEAERQDSQPAVEANGSQRSRRNAAVVEEINRREMNIN